MQFPNAGSSALLWLAEQINQCPPPKLCGSQGYCWWSLSDSFLNGIFCTISDNKSLAWLSSLQASLQSSNPDFAKPGRCASWSFHLELESPLSDVMSVVYHPALKLHQYSAQTWEVRVAMGPRKTQANTLQMMLSRETLLQFLQSLRSPLF